MTDPVTLPAGYVELLATASSLTSLSPDRLINSCLARLLTPSPEEQLRAEIQRCKIYFRHETT